MGGIPPRRRMQHCLLPFSVFLQEIKTPHVSLALSGTRDRWGTALFGLPTLQGDQGDRSGLPSGKPCIMRTAGHAPGFRKSRDSGLKLLTPLSGVLGPLTRATKPIVVVAVTRIVVVAIGRPRVPRIVVEGTAAGCDQPPFMTLF